MPIFVPQARRADSPVELIRQQMGDVLRLGDAQALDDLAQEVAVRARTAQEERRLWWREPFWYAANTAALAGATNTTRIRLESASTFEAEYAARYTRNETTGAINNPRSCRTRVFYPGLYGKTGKDTSAPTVQDQFRNQNVWGDAGRPARYVWPRQTGASGVVEIEYLNDEANTVTAQFAFLGTKVYAAQSPRALAAKKPYRREPFSYAVSFTNAPVNINQTAPIQLLEHADFELLYITQDSIESSNGDFEALLKESGDRPRSLSNIPMRRNLAYGTVGRPTIMAWPRYFLRGSRLLAEYTNRAFNNSGQSVQIALHGNLVF